MTSARRTITMTDLALYRLMTWLSPAYPIGSFSYSHGIEYAVEAGLIGTAADLCDWIATAVRHGAGRSDAVLFAAAWRAAAAEDDAELDAVADLAAAWRGTRETALESAAQGAAFLATTRAAWPHPALEAMAARRGGAVAFPVAVAIACAAHGVPIGEALTAYLHAFAGTLVSAGIRLIPLGQTDGQKILAALAPVIAEAVASALAASLDDVGTATPLLDWCSMRHETQYTRLFRS
jgi:urease accessory protein